MRRNVNDRFISNPHLLHTFLESRDHLSRGAIWSYHWLVTSLIFSVLVKYSKLPGKIFPVGVKQFTICKITFIVYLDHIILTGFWTITFFKKMYLKTTF